MLQKPRKHVRSKSSQNEEEGAFLERQRHSFQTVSDFSLREVRKLLRRKMLFTYDLKAFIPVPSIKTFWTAECALEEFLSHSFSSGSSAHTILTASIQVFTALVLVEWDSEDRFRQVARRKFLDDTERIWTDDSFISLTEADFSDLSKDEVAGLNFNRNLVSVPVLGMSKESKPFPEHTTLPITAKTEIGKGAYGKVHEIKIAEGCLKFEHAGGTVTYNRAEDSFALKELNDPSESQREIEFLREYRANSRRSEHIVTHLIIIERGNEASVIYPLATGDLQNLLEGEVESYKWGKAGQVRDIVKKSCDLADGLDFLHSDMHNYSNLVCRHGDLKPNNFLIYPAGWKISDMGLARVKTATNDESGVRKTTKTTSKDGCGPYAAPEMSGPEGTLIGRETDVWSLAAIIMELIIWGFGGPGAWGAFVHERNECSKGLFHTNYALSQAVEKELASWPGIHVEKMSRFLNGDNTRASQFLKDLVTALRGAFEINPIRRATSKDFLESIRRVYKHFGRPVEMKQGMATSTRLEIRDGPSTIAWQALQRKFDEHRQPKIFSRDFKPHEQIRVSAATADCVKIWIRQPTPSALCILKKKGNEWLHVSAITHEVYYTARNMDYQVVEFLTLDRYNYTASPLQASLDLVYCFIYQLLKNTPKDRLKEHPLERLAIVDSSLSEELKFESAVDVLRQIINMTQKNPESKPIIVIVDEFWQVCKGTHSDATRKQWELLLALLGCTAMTETNGKSNAGPQPVAPNFRVLIRANGWFKELQGFGFNGQLCIPSTVKQHNSLNLRTTLEGLFKNVG